MFVGADQPPVPLRARDKMLLQRSGQLMYELSTIYPAISGARPEWSWDVTHDMTVDGLPYVGLHRNFPRHLFALGHGRHGAAVAWLAARLLAPSVSGRARQGRRALRFRPHPQVTPRVTAPRIVRSKGLRRHLLSSSQSTSFVIAARPSGML